MDAKEVFVIEWLHPDGTWHIDLGFVAGLCVVGGVAWQPLYQFVGSCGQVTMYCNSARLCHSQPLHTGRLGMHS